MKRNLFCALLALALTLSLAACGGGDGNRSSAGSSTGGSASQSNGGGTSSSQQQPNAGPDSYVFQAGGTSVSIDQDMAEVLAALGEPQSYFEAESCAFEGLDKTYTYSGFVITTRPDGEKDFVNSILLTDDSATTPEGIYIGSSADDIKAAYGEGEGTDALMTYTRNGTALNFILDNGKVFSIEYLPE